MDHCRFRGLDCSGQPPPQDETSSARILEHLDQPGAFSEAEDGEF
jgi:hypothetical protein